MSGPEVSVVVTAFNQEGTVCDAVASALEQTRESVEVIVVDDGSTDGTRQRLRRRFGDDVRYVYRENGGPGAARNEGIREARGAFVQFLDGDDLLLPDKLARQLDELARRPGYPAAYCDYAFFVDDPAPQCRTAGTHRDRCRSGDLWRSLLVGNFLLNHTPVVALDWVRGVGGFDEDRRLSGCEEYDLWLRLSHRGCRFHYVDEVLALYRQGSGSLSRDLDAQRRRTIRVLEKVPTYAPRLPAEERAARGWYLARLNLFVSAGELKRGHPLAAARHLGAAIRHDPRLVPRAPRALARRWAAARAGGGGARA